MRVHAAHRDGGARADARPARAAPGDYTLAELQENLAFKPSPIQATLVCVSRRPRCPRCTFISTGAELRVRLSQEHEHL